MTEKNKNFASFQNQNDVKLIVYFKNDESTNIYKILKDNRRLFSIVVPTNYFGVPVSGIPGTANTRKLRSG